MFTPLFDNEIIHSPRPDLISLHILENGKKTCIVLCSYSDLIEFTKDLKGGKDYGTNGEKKCKLTR